MERQTGKDACKKVRKERLRDQGKKEKLMNGVITFICMDKNGWEKRMNTI